MLPDAVDLIRFEKNLLQIGFFGANERRGKNLLSRRIEQWVNRDGKKIKVSAEFRSSDELGLPSTSDRDKYMGFMKLAMETKLRTGGVITNPIRFSGYSLLNVLGQCDSGENYEALNSWGKRMADTTITSEQVIYSSLRKRYMNKTVHVFRSFTRLGASDLDGSNRTEMFEVELEDWLLENLNESFVVPEDFAMYRKLARPTSKGIFVYLYVWFFASQGKEVEKDYTELCALLNIRTYEHVSKIRETMGLALMELMTIGYLKNWEIKSMTSKRGYKLVLTPGPAIKEILLLTRRKQIAASSTQSTPPLSDLPELAKAALITQGVSESKAEELARKYKPLTLLDQVEYVISQIQSDRKKNIKNPAGFLINFIESEQQLPPTFQTSRERQASQAKSEEETAQSLAEMQLREEYEKWQMDEVDAVISRELKGELLTKKLNETATQLRRDEYLNVKLNKMAPEIQRSVLMQALRREVLKELNLSPFEEWRKINSQGGLF
jgi:hypothetical protein